MAVPSRLPTLTGHSRRSTSTTFDPTYVRIVKTGDNGVNAYAGLDDIDITARPAVFLLNLTNSTGVPTIPHDVDIFADAIIHPTGSNIVISAFYRHDPNGTFTEIPMSLEAGITYKTTTPVPFGLGLDSDFEYYVQAAFDEGDPKLVFPAAGGIERPCDVRDAETVWRRGHAAT